MAQEPQTLPLLLFPRASTPAPREKLDPQFPRLSIPSSERQAQRISPKLQALQTAFEAKTLLLQAEGAVDNPELVLVFEVIGLVDAFIKAVKRTSGLEWLLEEEERGLEPDEDFFDERRADAKLDGRLFLVGSNLQALNHIISLWNRYLENPNVTLERGFAPWKVVFSHLKDIRFWSYQDRLSSEMKDYWRERLEFGEQIFKFEVEAWCYESAEKNQATYNEVSTLVSELGGNVLSRTLLNEISYHGLLIEMPAHGIVQLLDDTPAELVLSERVMFFRPRGQAIAERDDVIERTSSVQAPPQLASGEPIIALLDGLPLQNHPLLAGRIFIDDPDGWEDNYLAIDRNHGTAMASLILLGELDGNKFPMSRPIYCRPILKPNISDANVPKSEETPNDVLLIDLIHRAVRRIFEGDGGEPAVAPSVKVINLSVGDPTYIFDRLMSPWAKLIDWLSWKYDVLFIVSAGNYPSELMLATPPNSLVNMAVDLRNRLALQSLLSDTSNKRLMAPAEAMNALTVGAVHTDASSPQIVPTRYDLFGPNGISPFSRVGHGYRRAIKPDILFSGGRVLFTERLANTTPNTKVSFVKSSVAPGHRVAAPSVNGLDDTKYMRGTSNAAALISRNAAFAYEVIEQLRAGNTSLIPARFDVVLIKALLAHGAEWGALRNSILDISPHIQEHNKKVDFVSRLIGYGLADIGKALTCTQQRATLIGVGSVNAGESIQFRSPLPPSLNARVLNRRLTITLAWISPINTRNAKYRSAKLWIDPPNEELAASRLNCDWRNVKRGTLQHEIFEGTNALAFVDGAELVFTINCIADTGIKLIEPVKFALCVSLEVAEGIDVPIYQEISDRVRARVEVATR